MKISPLIILGSRRLPSGVAGDLLPPSLFGEDVVEILLHPCNEEELLARREVLEAFLHPQTREALRGTLQALRGLERSVTRLRGDLLPLERLFGRVQAGRAYVEAGRALRERKDDGPRFAAIAEALESEETLASLEAVLPSMETLLQPLQSVSLSIAEKHWLTADAPVSYAERIRRAAAVLGLEAPPLRVEERTVNPALSQGILTLYAKEVAELEALLEAHPLPDPAPLLELIPQFQFGFAMADLVQRAEERGIPFCFPTLSKVPAFTARELYDVTLLASQVPVIVPNDLYFTSEERFFFLTGANGGGKTSYLRAVGVNLLLCLAGCPVFAKEATVYPFSGVLTHFPADERFSSVGRLEEEKRRVEELLALADDKTWLLFNETFSGANEEIGLSFAVQTGRQMQSRDLFGLFVTHFHGVREEGFLLLNTLTGEENARTYRILRDFGLRSSYAETILKKYGLDEAALQRRADAREDLYL